MHRTTTTAALVLVVALAAVAHAGLITREYAFRTGAILEIDEETPDGLRIDNVRFQTPSKVEGKLLRVTGTFTAEVAVSNTGSRPAKVGVAIALHDAEGRLVGVASGGNKVGSIPPGRQKSFTVTFDGVSQHVLEATSFEISLESKE